MMATFYDDWLQADEEIQQGFKHAKHVARDAEIPWVSTRQDAKVKLMIANNLGFATMGGNVLKAEIPPAWHTGKHSHGEESMHILEGEGFSIIDLEDAPADEEFPGHNKNPASQNQHHYIKYLVAPENGFKATSVAVTNLWEEPAGTHSGRHKHLEAVVYAYSGRGVSEMEGHEHGWRAGDVLHVPPFMLEHEHYNPSSGSYWQLRIGFGIRYWWQDSW